jgi:hypothetical protein
MAEPASIGEQFRFYGCFAEAVLPRPADPTARQQAPMRAVAHCEPFRAAAGWGWYLYPPIDFLVKWDGMAFEWMPKGSDRWLPLKMVPVRTLRRYSGADDNSVDDYVLDHTFIGAAPEPGVLQVWTGLVAVIPRDWALLVRGLPNVPAETGAYETLEGIIEAGWYHGPLVTNLRFRKTDQVVQFLRRTPIFAVQPIPVVAYQSELPRTAQLVPATADNQDEIANILAEADGVHEASPGGYRREVRRRRRETAGAE